MVNLNLIRKIIFINYEKHAKHICSVSQNGEFLSMSEHMKLTVKIRL